MKSITQEALHEIMKIYAKEQKHQEMRAAHDATGVERGWLQVQMADVDALVSAREFIKSFGDERLFLYALAQYLTLHKLTTPLPKKKPAALAPDFVDMMQDRVV